MPHEIVFAQILLGFELASSDPRFVGLNLVMPEDWYVPIHDFNEHMAMIDYLHGVYPKVHIALHAGELAMGLVPPEDLAFHIRASVERGHAERIGHGVSVMNEKDPIGLLHEMAERNVLVEIALTSNDMILGVSGDDHPLPVYMKYGVPVALATDDEGVSRSDMTHEYLRAIESYHLSYADLKRMARQSLEHSFLPGESLWAETKLVFRMAASLRGRCGRRGEAIGGMRAIPRSQRTRPHAMETGSRVRKVREEILEGSAAVPAAVVEASAPPLLRARCPRDSRQDAGATVTWLQILWTINSRSPKPPQSLILQRTPLRPQIGLVLGSGLGGFADSLTDATRIPYAEIPAFPRSTAIGHAGQMVIGKVRRSPRRRDARPRPSL